MTGSERPSPEPLLKKEASPAVLGGREFWKRSGSLKCLELQGLGDLEGNSRKRSESVSRVFPEFPPESPSRTGGDTVTKGGHKRLRHRKNLLRRLSLLVSFAQILENPNLLK